MPRQPLYAQIEDALLARITTGLAPGDRLSTEDHLIKEFGASRITVRRAVQNLVARGVVVTQQGRGTFVAERQLEQPLTALTGFVEDMEALGLGASAELITAETVPASPAVAAQLDLLTGSPVDFIERVRLAEGRPVSFDQTWLPGGLAEGVVREDLENQPIFTLLEEKHGIPLREATYRLRATRATEHVAEHLQIAPGEPILLVERTTFTTGKEPIDYELLHYRGDAITFVTSLSRPAAGADR